MRDPAHDRPLALVVAGALLLACFPTRVQASCNLIPGATQLFHGALGATDRPYSAPGERMQVRLRSCDPGRPLSLEAADHVVTVIFTPSGGTPHAKVLATDCAAINSKLAACRSRLGGGAATASCTAAPEAGLAVVERGGEPFVSFRFPSTDDLFLPDGDGFPLTGPVIVAVSDPSKPLPCDAASSGCLAHADAAGVRACIDQLFANDGSCGTAVPLDTFPSLTALPSPNDYEAACFRESPPCDGTAPEVQLALDAEGNMLIPFVWQGILVHDAGVSVPRLLRATVKSPLPFTVPDQVFLGSFTPEGGRLPPIFEPQVAPEGEPGVVTLFGSADAPYTVLRVARRHGTCHGGDLAGERCAGDPDCPGGSCAPSCVVDKTIFPCTSDADCPSGSCGELFDFAPLAMGGGPISVPRTFPAIPQMCQVELPEHKDCTGNPGACTGMGNACVTYAFEVETPVPLEGLAASDHVRAFTLREGIDLVNRNGDDDIIDSVATLRDRQTGELRPLDVPPGCGLDENLAVGRAVIRTSTPPFRFPAVEVDGETLAILESETAQNACDLTGEGDGGLDAVPRLFDPTGAEVALVPPLAPPLLRAVDAAPLVNGRSIALSGGRLFFRSSEPAMAGRVTEAVSVSAEEGPGNSMVQNGQDAEISADGRFVAFASLATNLVDPPDANPAEDIFVRDLVDDTTEIVSVTSDEDPADDASRNPAISADGRFIAFRSRANLDGDAPGGGPQTDIFLRDRIGGTTTLVTFNPSALPTVEEADKMCERPAISADGSVVAFHCLQDIPDTGDGDGTSDVYVWDGGMITLVSDGDDIDGAERPSLSADGKLVAFTATDVLGGRVDVFVHDRDTQTRERVSRSPSALDPHPNDNSDLAKVSADGRFVTFQSLATNLPTVGADTNGDSDVFVFDRVTGMTERVSIPNQAPQAFADSLAPAISGDGRHVAFVSKANLLDEGPGDGDPEEIYVHDRVTGISERASLASNGSEITARNLDPAISANGRVVVFTSQTTQLGADANPESDDVFARVVDPAAATVDAQLYADGAVDDTVLEVANAVTGEVTTLCPAEQVVVAGGNTAFLRPEATFGTLACPGASLNPPDSDTDDLVVHRWIGGAVDNLGRAATALAMSDNWIAALVSEAGDDAQYNGDPDFDDTVVQLHPVSAVGTWLNVGVAANRLGISEDVAVFITDNGVLQWVRAPTPGSPEDTGQAAEEFVIGRPSATVCGPRHLVAFRTSEAAQGEGSLNAASGDVDVADAVLQLVDLETGGLPINTGQAVTPCLLEACDPRQPYRVEGSKVIFLTNESEQDEELTGDDPGEARYLEDLVLQIFDVCSGFVTVVGAVDRAAKSDPLTKVDESIVTETPGGRCDLGVACDPEDDQCGDGAFCEKDSCSGAPKSCQLHQGLACTTDANCHRCVLRQPGACATDEDCPDGSTCGPAVIVAAATVLDSDDDGVADEEDNCPTTPNTAQTDGDDDGAGDSCHECSPTPLAGCKRPVTPGKALLMLRDRTADRRDMLSWQWLEGEATMKAEFGDPVSSDTYALCLYDGSGLVTSARVPHGGFCNRGKPCWTERRHGFAYADQGLTPDGILSVVLREGIEDGKTKVIVKARGGLLGLPDPGSLSSPLTVQLHRAGGPCWESVYGAPFLKQQPGFLKDRAD